MEEKILQSKTSYNFETVKKFNKFHMYSQVSTKIVSILSIFLILFAILANDADASFRMITAIIAIVWFVEILILPNLHTKKALKSSKIHSNSTIEFEFYNEKVVLNTVMDGENIGNTIVKYEDFYKVCDTKDAIYMYVANNQAFICSKENMEGDYNKVSEILKEKLDKKYKIKK
ncbi:MAG: YcxB family protein [Clostridia bacterium]|nr:YcxB family protein [Clostridia bacterium]